MGYKQDKAIVKLSPEERRILDDYYLCRGTDLIVFVKPESGGKQKVVSCQWPFGIMHWPEGGSLAEQSFLTVRLFQAALRAEQRGAGRTLSK